MNHFLACKSQRAAILFLYHRIQKNIRSVRDLIRFPYISHVFLYTLIVRMNAYVFYFQEHPSLKKRKKKLNLMIYNLRDLRIYECA